MGKGGPATRQKVSTETTVGGEGGETVALTHERILASLSVLIRPPPVVLAAADSSEHCAICVAQAERAIKRVEPCLRASLGPAVDPSTAEGGRRGGRTLAVTRQVTTACAV